MADHFREALAAGRLEFQRCGACMHAWLPERDACPRCLAPDPAWEPAGGDGRIVSWTTLHHAFDPGFADRVPYDVAIVELAEGPRLITGLVDIGRDAIACDLAVHARVDALAEPPVVRFGPPEPA